MSNVVNIDSYRKKKEKPDEDEKNVNNRVSDLNSYIDSRYKNKPDAVFDYCLHDCCPRCHGTGIREDNQKMCIHHLNCRCEKCIGFN